MAPIQVPEQVSDEGHVRLGVELELPAVLDELLELDGGSPGQSSGRGVVVFLSRINRCLRRGAGDAMWDFQTLPGELTKQEVDEYIADRLQVVSARRLDALVVRDEAYRGVPVNDLPSR